MNSDVSLCLISLIESRFIIPVSSDWFNELGFITEISFIQHFNLVTLDPVQIQPKNCVIKMEQTLNGINAAANTRIGI